MPPAPTAPPLRVVRRLGTCASHLLGGGHPETARASAPEPYVGGTIIRAPYPTAATTPDGGLSDGQQLDFITRGFVVLPPAAGTPAALHQRSAGGPGMRASRGVCVCLCLCGGETDSSIAHPPAVLVAGWLSASG